MAKQKLREVTGKSNGGSAIIYHLLPNHIEDILDESFMGVEAFQRLMEGFELSGGKHLVSMLDVSTVLHILHTAARDRAQELLEAAAGAPELS